jgi:hypothetical protein
LQFSNEIRFQMEQKDFINRQKLRIVGTII